MGGLPVDYVHDLATAVVTNGNDWLLMLIRVAVGYYTLWRAMLVLVALGWGILLLLCLWPPMTLLLPRVETQEGWRVTWMPFIGRPEEAVAPGDNQGEVGTG